MQVSFIDTIYNFNFLTEQTFSKTCMKELLKQKHSTSAYVIYIWGLQFGIGLF